MAKDFMDTQTGGTSNYESNPDVKAETETVLPTSAAASSIQKANAEPQSTPDAAVSQEGKEVIGADQESVMAPMIQNESPADLSRDVNEEQAINVDPNMQGLEEIMAEEGIDLFISDEDKVLNTEPTKPEFKLPEINSTPIGPVVFTNPTEDNPISMPDVDEESNLNPVNEIGQPIVTDETINKDEAKLFNEENKDKGIKARIDGGFVFEQDVNSPFDFFNTLNSMEGIDPEEGKTPGYYEMPGAKRGRYLKDSEGDWFKIYTNKEGKRVKRRMIKSGRRAMSLEDNSQLIAPVDSNFSGLWELDDYQFFKGKRDEENFVYSSVQDLDEVTVERYRRFNYGPEEIKSLKSTISKSRKHKNVDVNDSKQLADILKPDWEYRYGGKKYMKSGGKWFFISKNGTQKEVKYDLPSIEAYSKPVTSLGGLSSGYIKNRFNATIDFIKDKAQDFQNSFSEAISSGGNALLDYAAWSASKNGQTVFDVMSDTFTGTKGFFEKGYLDGMTSKELMRAQIEILDHFGVIASSEIEKYSKEFSLSLDSYFADNPYQNEAYAKDMPKDLKDIDFSTLLPDYLQGEEKEAVKGFNPYQRLYGTKQGREHLSALGYLSRHNGYQPTKTSGIYSIGDLVATKDASNNWTDLNGNPISDINKISSLESAGAFLSEENIINSLRQFTDVEGSERKINLATDSEAGKLLNSNKRLLDFVMSRPYISDSSTAIHRFLTEENGGNGFGNSESFGGVLLSTQDSANLASKLSMAVKEYNGFLSSEEKLINFSNRKFSNIDQPFTDDQVKMLQETQMEALKTINDRSTSSEYFQRVNEIYESARNTIQNMYTSNEKLQEIDASGMTVDGYMYNSKRNVIPTLSNLGDSEQINQAMNLWKLNSEMISTITDAESDGKLDISKDGTITFTDRVSEQEKQYITEKISQTQNTINLFSSEATSANLDEISKIKSTLQNIPVAVEKLSLRLANLDPESQEYGKTKMAISILDRLYNINDDKIKGIKQATDAILKTRSESLMNETKSHQWMKQHLASIPSGKEFSAKNRFDFLFESMNNKRLELESQLDVSASGLAYDKIKDLLSITGGLTDKEKEYYQTTLTVRSLAPLYLNNNYGVETDKGAGEEFFEGIMGSYYKFFFPNTYVRGSVLGADIVSSREYAREVTSFMNEAGFAEGDYASERQKIALENFGNKELGIEDPEFWGDQIGNGLAFVSAIYLTMQGLKGGYKVVNGLSKIGRGAEAVGIAEKVVTTANNAYSAVMNSNAITRFFINPIAFGAQFKVGGLPFNQEVQEKMNFESGLLGGMFASGLIGTSKAVRGFLGTTLGKNRYLQEVFGDKYSDVLKLLVSKSKGLRKTVAGESTLTMFGLGAGETTKEIREELTLAWQSSDKGKAAWDVIEKNYGTYDQRMKFVVSSFIMGAFFHMGANYGKAKRVYDTLTPEQKTKVDNIKSMLEKQSKEAIEASEKVMKEEVERYSGEKTAEKIEKESKSKKDDSKDQEGVSSEKQKGEEPVKEKPVEETGKEETSTDRVLQEEQAEVKEEVKAEEESVVPDEIESERVSLRINEEKSQDSGRDVYEVYDEVGSKIGEISTGMEANGDIVVENISITEGSQKKGYAKEAVEAINDATESNVMVDNTNPNTKVVGESLAKQDNANVNESGMVELETNKPPVENTEGMSRSQKAANAVRQLKLNFDTNGQTFGSMLPFDKAWNFAVESAAKIIEAGGTASRAYSRAMNSYKNSNFYKSLKTAKEKQAEMAKFEEALSQELGDSGFLEAVNTMEKQSQSFKKVKEEAKKSEYYQGLRKKNGKPDSVRRKKFIDDLREDFDAKVSRKVSEKMTKEEKTAADEAREASSKEGRFQSQYESALSEAVESLKGKSSKQIELSAARARIRASEKYQKLNEKDRAKYLEDMTRKAATKIGTRADYASRFMEDSITKAEEKYKESEFYKEATPERQTQMLEDFRSNARRIIEEKVESSMDVDSKKELVKKLKEIDPKVVKKSNIERGMGQRVMEQAGRKSKVEYKVTLKQMIADKAKFTKEGAKYMQSVKDSVTEYARLNMPKGKYSNTELSYVLNRVKKAKTMEDVGKAFEEIDAMIDKKLGKQLTSLRKETKKKYTGRGLDKQFYRKDKNGNKVYKIKDLQARKEIMDFIKENVTESAIENMDLAELQELNETVGKMIKDGRADSIAKEKLVDNAKRRQKAAIIEAAPESFKNRNKDVTDMESLYDHMQVKDSYFIADGQFYNKTAFEVVNRDAMSEFKKTEDYKSLETKEAKKEAEREFLIDNSPFDFASSKIDAYNRFSQRTRASRTALSTLRETKAVQKAIELGINRGKLLYFDNMDLGGQMMYMARGNKAMLEFIETRVKEPILRAGVRYEKETGLMGEAHEKALTDAFGDTLVDSFNKYIGKIVYGKVPKTAQRLKDTPVDLRKNGDPNGEIILDPDTSTQKDIKSGPKSLGKFLKKSLTNAQLVNTYLLGKSRMKKEVVDGKEVDVETNVARQRLIDQGYDVKAVDEYMSRPENSDLVKYADWLDNYYNETARKAYESIFKEITEGGEFSIENYYPQTAEGKGLGQEGELFMDEGVSFSDLLISKEMIRDSYVKERTNQGQLDVTKGADDVFRNYVRSMTRLKHFYEPTKSMGELVNDSNIAELMEFQGGKNAMDGMKESFKMVASGKTKNPGTTGMKSIGKLQGLTTLMTLMLKTANLPKQFTSFTHFWSAGTKYGLGSENAFLAGISPITKGNLANPFGLTSFAPGSPRFGLAKNTTAKEDAAFLTEVLTSQFIKRRIRGGAQALEIDVARMIEDGGIFGTSLQAAKKNASNTLLLFTRLGDMAGVLLGPYGGLSFSVNLYRKYRGDGLSVKEATEKAYENFVIEAQSAQQTSELYYRSKFQQGNASRFIGMFKTSQSLAAKKVLNSIELLRSGKDLNKQEKAQAISDMIHFSVFASLGFTATATGAMWLLTGDTPFELNEREEKAFKEFYGDDPSKMEEVLGEVRTRMVYETVMDNFQAISQGYGVPGFLIDATLNGLRDRDAFNNSPVFNTLLRLVDATGSAAVKPIVDAFSSPGRFEESQDEKYKLITGKEAPNEDPNIAIKAFMEAADILNVKDNAEDLAEFFDLLSSEEATMKDLFFKFNGWNKNFMENITKYQRDDWIFEKGMGEKITDIRPESYKEDARIEYEKNLDELRREKRPIEERLQEKGYGKKEKDIMSYEMDTSKERIEAFKKMYKSRKSEIDEFYKVNDYIDYELKEIIGD